MNAEFSERMVQQAAPLLRTKLFVVRPKPDLVPRERLLRLLDGIPYRKLILLSASAGFGKTTLIGAWIASRSYPTAWYSLDRGDNETARFFTYLIAALQTVHPAVGESARQALTLAPLPPIESLVSSIINDIASLSDSFLLVLEDYHVIENDAIHEALMFLLDHAPPQLHVAVTTRIDPPIPIARLRVRGDLLELRASDLRFSGEESASLFNDTMRLNLSADSVAAVQERTEGWIAGLQMAGLSLHGRDDVEDFISAFTGEDRYVIDYLLEEVLTRQPEDLQRIMLDLSIVERFNASLCEAITGCDDGTGVLDRLERANLFMTSLDNRREWYRYHHLFADLLGHRLRQLRPDSIAELHRRASTWQQKEGRIREAVEHAVRSGDPGFIADLTARSWRRLLNINVQYNMPGLLNDVPDELVLADPRVAVVKSWILCETQKRADLMRYVDRAEELVGEMERNDEARELLGHIYMIRTVIARDTLQNDETIRYGKIALEFLPDREADSPDFHWFASPGLVFSNLGGAYLRLADYETAEEVFEAGLRHGRARSDTYSTVSALSDLGRMSFAQGRLARAEHYAEELKTICEENLFLPADAGILGYHLYSTILFEKGDFARAEEYALRALGLCKPHLIHEIVEVNRLLFAIYCSAGNLGEAWHAVRSAEEALSGYDNPPLSRIIQMERIKLELREGRLDRVREWAEEFAAVMHDYQTGGGGPMRFLIERLLYGRVLVALGRLDEAITVLDELQTEFSAENFFRMRLGALLPLSGALNLRGDEEGAIRTLSLALRLAAPERFIRAFAQEAELLAPVLALYKKRGYPGSEEIPEAFIVMVYEKCGAGAPAPTAPQRTRRFVGGDLLDPLTSREVEILQLMAQGYSNRIIAEKLYVSVNTIKTHVSNLFGKLDAANRVEALARAREANVL